MNMIDLNQWIRSQGIIINMSIGKEKGEMRGSG